MSSRICKFGCRQELGEWHDDIKKYMEADNKTVHDRERCTSLKEKKNGTVQEKLTNGHNEISLELVIRKLALIGVTLDLEKLKNV